MTLVHLLVILVIAGVLLYLLNTLVPMDAGVKKVINVVALTVIGLTAFLWLLGFLGVDTGWGVYAAHGRCR